MKNVTNFGNITKILIIRVFSMGSFIQIFKITFTSPIVNLYEIFVFTKEKVALSILKLSLFLKISP
jgi:hypothetical protein